GSSGIPTPHTVGDMVAMARQFLERKGVAEARFEADLLVGHALGLDRLHLLLELERPLEGDEIDRARDLLVRRGRREPTAYIVGEREFYARPFRVGPGVLVPRPETELLIDLARDHVRDGAVRAPRVFDVGTGSGNLAITLALEIEGAEVLAVDRSPQALVIARDNGVRSGAEVLWVEGDGLEVGDARGPFDVVVSNPPYVDRAVAGELAPEVLEHEPHQALFAPDGDPDYWVRELVARRERWLKPGGLMAIELGFDQAARLREIRGVRFERDLAGIERALVVRG
ncbi:MAG: peptide chain release factor N(5)-glutamine methyltransferase, partial [Planctomycetota bacterium]|nr:peptide chain release factor N(5)-glutamine methyltransferase [Planctomycetota bacterium]